MDFTTKNLNEFQFKETPVGEEDWSDYHSVQPFPLNDALIYVKTIEWKKKSCLKEFAELQSAVYTGKPR